MSGVISRTLSIVVVLITMWRAWSVFNGEWYVTLGVVPVLVPIWAPQWVDELTFGASRGGYQIDAHTPAFLIVAVGWLLLLLYASAIVAPDAWCKAFGAC
jgi:hypothetical protein